MTAADHPLDSVFLSLLSFSDRFGVSVPLTFLGAYLGFKKKVCHHFKVVIGSSKQCWFILMQIPLQFAHLNSSDGVSFSCFKTTAFTLRSSVFNSIGN